MQAKWLNAVALRVLLLGSSAPTLSAAPNIEETPASPSPTLLGAPETLPSENFQRWLRTG